MGQKASLVEISCPWVAETRRRSDVHDGAGERSDDTIDALDFGDDQTAESVDISGGDSSNDIVWAGDDDGLGDAGHLGQCRRHGELSPNLGLDQYIRVDHCSS